MHRPTRTLLLVWTFVCLPAFAQPARTFVASTGSDANPCSRLQPCRNFGTAIAATASGGEVIVLDSAGYGLLNITTSVSIIAPPGVYAGIAAANGSAVLINAPGAIVALHGLSINGQGASTGVQVAAVGTLYVERCSISRFTGYGFNFATNGRMYVADTVFRDNDFGLVAGIGGAIVTGSVIHSRAENNTTDGFSITGVAPPPSTMTQVLIRDSAATNNGGTGFSAYAAELSVRDCVAAKNPTGMTAAGGGILNVSNSMVVDSSVGFFNPDGSTINTFGNNQLVRNLTATSGTITPVGMQ